MKVFILTEGSSSIGFGHITRCISLAEAFREKNIESEFIVNGDGSVQELLGDKSYCIFNWITEQSRLLEMIVGSEIVIIDSYLAGEDLYGTISASVKIPVYLDDNKRLDYPKGVVVNGNIYAKELNYPFSEKNQYILGTKYTPLRRPFWDESNKIIRRKVENIMITFGGADSRNLTPNIVKLLREEYPALKKNVIVGGAFANTDEIEKEFGQNINLIFYPNAEEIKNIILSSDCVISSGGQTLYELACLGTPALAVCVSKNQELNLKRFYEAGIVEFVGWYNDVNLGQKIIESIQNLLARDRREERSSLEKKLLDGQGARRVASSILSYMSEEICRK